MQRRMGMMMVLTVMLAGGLLSALRVKMLAISYGYNYIFAVSSTRPRNLFISHLTEHL
jgi:hypothetical protein